jgi:hypothetical protein
MSNIKFEVVESTAQIAVGSVFAWLIEVCEVAKQHEGQTLRIDLTAEMAKFPELTAKDVQLRVNQYKHPYKSRSKRFALSAEGYEVVFRGITSTRKHYSTNPCMFITYNKPITESEG